MPVKKERTQLPGIWRTLARLAWLAFALLVIAAFVLGAQQVYREKSTLCTASPQDCRNNWLLTESDLQELGATPAGLPTYARLDLALKLIAVLVCYSVAGLIVWRRPDDWLALLVALWILLIPGANGITIAAGRVVPGLASIVRYLSSLSWISLGFLLALFPNGRFVPRWSKGYILVWAILFLLPPGVSDKIPEFVTGLVFISFFLFAPTVQFYRYRHVSTPLERQQTKWLVLGVGFSYGFMLLLNVIQLLFFPGLFEKTWGTVLLNWIIGLFQLTLPLSIGLAILRYRLWDIDLIIRRTLVWTAITVFLGLVYFGGVTLLQSIFLAISNQHSAISIVLSTLAIAALFNPLRKRVQEFVDRRFYRRKYDAEQALASFAALAREEVDLEELTARLLEVVEETVQPEHASLWLRKKEGRR